MGPVFVISFIGGIILLLLIIGTPLKPLRFAGAVAMRVIIGALLLFFLNTFGQAAGLHVPINIFTAGVSGLLGLPGVGALVAIKYIVLT